MNIELTSLYRNRNADPNPFSFEIITSENFSKNINTHSYDPVSEQAPIIEWVGLNTKPIAGKITFSQKDLFIVFFDKSKHYLDLRQNFYKNFSSNFGVITSCKSLSESTFSFTVDVKENVDSTIIGASFIMENKITQKTKLTDTIIILIPQIIYQTTFCKYYICNDSIKENCQIIYFNPLNSFAFINGPINGWDDSHTYTIRKKPVYIYSKIAKVISSNIIELDKIDGIQEGDFVRNLKSKSIYKIDEIIQNNIRIAKISGISTIDRNSIFEVLEYSRDNLTPLDLFIKNNKPQRIKMTGLHIPNLHLENGKSIKNIPFVYVVLEDLNINNRRLHTNNPKIKNAIAKAFQEETNDDNYICFKSDNGSSLNSMVINSSSRLRLSILDNFGYLLNYTEKDSLSPILPNPDIQIMIGLNLSE